MMCECGEPSRKQIILPIEQDLPQEDFKKYGFTKTSEGWVKPVCEFCLELGLWCCSENRKV